VYHPAEGNWHIRYNNGEQEIIQWGWAAGIPVPADYNGDGKTDIAVYHPAEGNWHIRYNNGEQEIIQWGWAEAIPVPGDYKKYFDCSDYGSNFFCGTYSDWKSECNSKGIIYASGCDTEGRGFGFCMSCDSFPQCEHGICHDSDQGVNFYEQGTTSGIENRDHPRMLTNSDECNNGILTEWYCLESKYIVNQTYECPYGCEDGACVLPTNYTRYDTDYGFCAIEKTDDDLSYPEKIIVNNYVTGQTIYDSDSCINTTHLKKVVCSEQFNSEDDFYDVILCEKGCYEDVCIRCISEYYTACHEGNLYWYNSCDEIEYLAEECEHGCDDGGCIGCEPNEYKECYNNNVYWFDSCGNRKELVENCIDYCEDAECRCDFESYTACYDNNLYWHDSCNEREGLAEICELGCQDDACCELNSYTACYNGHSYWHDSCGNPQDDLYLTCDLGCEGNICYRISEIDPYNYICDSGGYSCLSDDIISEIENLGLKANDDVAFKVCNNAGFQDYHDYSIETYRGQRRLIIIGPRIRAPFLGLVNDEWEMNYYEIQDYLPKNQNLICEEHIAVN
ncbi:MAG: hypothetical protein ACMXX5_00800, partial [Candidatus Woesearchaeota archaeon]